MDVEPFPQGESEPHAAYGTFRCQSCQNIFPGDIPSVFEDLPVCPLCAAASCIYRVLETYLQH